MTRRLFVKVTHENLPHVKDRYPFIYLERGRLEVDDSSVKWIDCDGLVMRIPCATLQSILLGPGTSVTHEAVKVVAASNCTLCWVGEDSMLFFAVGQAPTADSRNMREQMLLSANPKKSLEVARRLFGRRLDPVEIADKNLKQMMGLEGYRVRRIYEEKAHLYGVGWKGRSYVPGKFEMSDITNKLLTSANAALYGIISSAIHSMGYSPKIGFIHSGSPLPFVYDMADLYKEYLCIDLAFALTYEMAGMYDKAKIAAEFRSRVVEKDLLGNISRDIEYVLYGERNDRGRS